MGKKRSAAAASLDEAQSSRDQEPKRSKRPSEMRVSLKALTNEQLEARWRDLADEVREAQAKQQNIRLATTPGRSRLDPVPKDRARTHAMNAVQKAEQAYLEAQGEWESRGNRIPLNFNPPRLSQR
eukprot:CAMPEP_0115216260 /NCGR_PEP_ID=MMETSP0270-20121206/25248_1 /TAXON_ID=71861 /ORGANISM="Scrippsiella trochoidea, Strain CCMP3099" /LENGTH=125 /DNA_ID=CAMNT_0002630095 /DNA_START=113 /DNA_END=490 /DNA_ORIENTATION=+